MTLRASPPDPFDVVAEALRCPKEDLSESSEMYRHHRWDSLGHIRVIVAIEEALRVSIDDGEAWKLTTMKAISAFFSRQLGTHEE